MTFSRLTMTGLALALGALATSTVDALAGGDVVQGAPVRHQVPAAIPVPVPVPVPEIATGFYVRIDAAYAQSDVDKYRSSGLTADQVRGDSYLNNFPRYGLGVGYQFNKRFRGDITIDWRNDVESRGTGNVDYSIPDAGGGAPIRMRDTISDEFKSTNVTGMANVYMDVPVTQSFTPYFGAGIGFVRHQLKGRLYSRTTTCLSNGVGEDCDPSAGPLNPGFTDLNSTGSTTAGGIEYSLAVALMAGITYNFSENGKIDLGYRWMHMEGATFRGRSATTVENLTIPEQNVHELRVGLRYDIN